MNPDLFQIPIFLFGLMYIVLPSAIPILITLWIVRKLATAGRKTGNAFRN